MPVKQEDREWWARWIAWQHPEATVSVAGIRAGKSNVKGDGDCEAVKMIAQHREKYQKQASDLILQLAEALPDPEDI